MKFNTLGIIGLKNFLSLCIAWSWPALNSIMNWIVLQRTFDFNHLSLCVSQKIVIKHRHKCVPVHNPPPNYYVCGFVSVLISLRTLQCVCMWNRGCYPWLSSVSSALHQQISRVLLRLVPQRLFSILCLEEHRTDTAAPLCLKKL